MPDSSTILLVDDEESVQKLLAYPLEREGFRVVQARDGQEALERFAAERIDLVVLDLMLPKLDGLEVSKQLRATSTVPARHSQHVFDRFYRIEGTLASGSGLGLAIARELAGLMGGDIALRSTLGRTPFTLTLPRGPRSSAFSRENVQEALA